MRFPFRRLHLRSRILAIIISIVLATLLLPYDNRLVLFVRWHLNSLSDALTARDSWLSERPRFPLNMDDVGIIVKTGFSTQDRLVARLDAFEPSRRPENLVLVGDYATAPGAHFGHNGVEIPVYNALAEMIGNGTLASRAHALRLQYYGNLTAAIAVGDMEVAKTIGAAYGWELDIMKHVSGLEIGYRAMRLKKWYILVDDDTYLLNGSLEAILQHLDPSVPHYIGNAVGDYKARFAHGGSAVVLSQAAMHRIFIQNPQAVAAAHLESLDAKWGDKLIATTAMKSGIYVEERYDRYFNGEAPRVTRIRSDRFCVPIVSFHKMSATEMVDVGNVFKGITESISWIDLWNIYNAPPFDEFLDEPTRPNWDHVGKLDESTMTMIDVKTESGCLGICHAHDSTCLAWTWEADRNLCHISPWMIVGEPADRRSSGINPRRAASLAAKCIV